MSSLWQHVAELHKTKAEHHAELGDHFGKLAKHFGKSEVADAGHVKEALAAISASHHAQAEYHANAEEACAKAEVSELEKGTMLVPTLISGITPDNPNFPRAIPRHGQPQPAGPKIVPEFAKAFDTEDVEDHTVA
jgi:hypothetical protein